VCFVLNNRQCARRPQVVESPRGFCRTADVTSTVNECRRKVRDVVDVVSNGAVSGHESVIGPIVRDQCGEHLPFDRILVRDSTCVGVIKGNVRAFPDIPGECGSFSIMRFACCQSPCVCIDDSLPRPLMCRIAELVPCLREDTPHGFGYPIHLGPAGSGQGDQGQCPDSIGMGQCVRE